MAHVTHHETRRNEVRVKVTRFWDAHGVSLRRRTVSEKSFLKVAFNAKFIDEVVY